MKHWRTSLSLGRYASTTVTLLCVTGRTNNALPTKYWSSLANIDRSAGNSTHIGRMTGAPVRSELKNSQYQYGSSRYREMIAERTAEKYTGGSNHGSRRRVSRWAWARKNGWNAPAWKTVHNFQRTCKLVTITTYHSITPPLTCFVFHWTGPFSGVTAPR